MRRAGWYFPAFAASAAYHVSVGNTESAYTVSQTAALLGVSTDTVYRDLGTKYRDVTSASGRRRVDASDVEKARAVLLQSINAVDGRRDGLGRPPVLPAKQDSLGAPDEPIGQDSSISDQRDETITRLRARTVELEEIARSLRLMIDQGLHLVDQRLAPDTLND